MASKDELFVQFREVSARVLGAAEGKQVKDVLGAFLQDKVRRARATAIHHAD